LSTPSISEVCFDAKPVKLMGYATSTINGVWIGHPNLTPGGTLDPLKDAQGVNNPMATGVYEFTYRTTPTPNTVNCPDSSTIKVPILNPPQPAIIPAGPLCSVGGTVKLVATPSDQGGSWTVTNYLTKNGVFTPSLAGVGNNPVQFVIGKPGCSKEKTQFVKIEAFVSASLTTKELPDICNTGAAMNLMPFVMNNTGNWQGPGIQGTSFNPGLAGKGQHVLSYTTASIPSGLCPDQHTIAVSVFSLATPNIAKVGPLCSTTEPLQLTADVQGGLYGGVNTQAVDLKGLFIPASAQIGDNVVNYTITSGPCVAYAQTTISVEKFVSAEFHTAPPTFCSNGEPVNMNHFVKNPGYTWAGDGIQAGSSMFDPRKANPGENNVITYYTHSTTFTLCPDKKEVRIKVVPLPPLSAVVHQNGSRCAPHEVVLNLGTSNNPSAKVFWTPGDGSPQIEGHTANHVYTRPGTYSVVLNYHLDGCKSQYQVPDPVRVFQSPQADFSVPQEVLISSPEIQVQNLSTPLGENTYTWVVEGVTVKPGEINPIIALPAELGTYNITLMARNLEGCQDEITKMIEVKNDFNIYIPTSFSPNFDNLNDVFRPEFSPYGLDLRTYEMEIFDRWGHLVFRTNDARQGWNGAVHNKGEACQPGVFVYVLRCKDNDGNSYSRQGHVSLLR
jgi:gliding motility-associated-like protein